MVSQYTLSQLPKYNLKNNPCKHLHYKTFGQVNNKSKVLILFWPTLGKMHWLVISSGYITSKCFAYVNYMNFQKLKR